jgi:hypothetical protein
MPRFMPDDIRTWAREGARLTLARIYAAFPDLKPTTATTAQPSARAKGASVRKRKRKKLSAARRREISLAMKAAWAKRKAEAVGVKGKAKGAR